MLQLNSDQTLALQAIKRRRDLAALRQGLAEVFPDVAARAGDRFEALVAHGVDRGLAHGLTHSVCLARYLACWFMLGAEFEARPEHAWAKAILAAPGRPQGSRIFQLCRRVQETLAQPASGQPTAPAFSAAITRLDAQLMPRGDLGSLLRTPTLRLGQACDLDALDLQWSGPAPQAYRSEQGQWQSVAGSPPASLRLQAGTPVPSRIHVFGRLASDREQARLRVRNLQGNACDAATHPLISYLSGSGLGQWRGRHAEDLQLPLYAEAAPDGIAVPGSPLLGQLGAASCGLRDSGPAFGSQELEVAVYPSSQQLLVWRREAAPAAGTASPPPRVRHELDGSPLNADRWQAGLADLDRRLEAGLARLATLWERESGVSRSHMDAEPAILVGTAGLAWGWATAGALEQPPRYRIAAAFDLLVCHLQLRLVGELQLHGSNSRLALHCCSGEVLKLDLESRPEDSDHLAVLDKLQHRFRQPFLLQIEALAGDDPAALLDLAGPPAGALTGACGLRARSDGPGLEWFFELAVEAVSARFIVNDPLLGITSTTRPLLPAFKLVHWSLS